MPLEKSNLYKLKILDSNENKTTFSKLFGPLAEAIQTGSNPCVFGPKPSIENYLVEDRFKRKIPSDHVAFAWLVEPWKAYPIVT